MRGWITLTLAANKEQIRVSVDHLVRYSEPGQEADEAKSSVGMTTGGSVRVLETPDEIDLLIEDAT